MVSDHLNDPDPCIHGIDQNIADCLECHKLLTWLEELDEHGQFTVVVLCKRSEPDAEPDQ